MCLTGCKVKEFVMYVGVDIGSTTSKAVAIDNDGNFLDWKLVMTEHDRDASGKAVVAQLLEGLGADRSEVRCIGATGYGRRAYTEHDLVYPEIVCHALGTDALVPGVKAIIDVGGQDCKAIECKDGLVMKFEMNDKCAAGTGRFFEVLSGRLLGTSIDDLGPMALKAEKAARLSSMCTVYAETEVVSLLSNNVSPNEIALGMLEAVFRRIISMAGQSGITFDEPTVLSGGIASNVAAAPTLSRMLGKHVVAIENPQMPAALGVALLAKRDYERGLE